MEVFQLAGEGAEIGGYAAVMFAITLVVGCFAASAVPTQGRTTLEQGSSAVWCCVQGLAIGFVLLRFEALVEEGKI